MNQSMNAQTIKAEPLAPAHLSKVRAALGLCNPFIANAVWMPEQGQGVFLISSFVGRM